MSSFVASSLPNNGSGQHRESRFTYKHLSQLHLSSNNCPLRVIAHVDLDAFYAQCEMLRLGIPEDRPLAVQQWQGLIAINYPARKYGLGRHVTSTEAKKICPELVMQHVATWREGDEKWAYHEDAWKHIATHKVSLDPYRQESRKILAVIKDVLPPLPVQRVEKASIDEVFLDLSSQIHSLLLQRYPELKSPPPSGDPTEHLPPPPTSALDWGKGALIDLDSKGTEDDDPDWDDVAMLLGSEIVRSVRGAIRERLKYTCSAGVAHNKMLAKLGSGHRKPNQQTIVRDRAVQHFLSEFKFTKIRNLGGKLGDQLVSTFGTDTVADLQRVSLDQLKLKVGDDTGTWVYGIIRGIDTSEVNPRTQIKSMLSAKSFRPSVNSMEQAVGWLRIFVADIFSRLVEDGVLENKRRPKTINLHHRHAGHTKSRQAPIPTGKAIDENLLFDIAKALLGQVVLEGNAWPCANLMLSVAGFEDGVNRNKGIGSFLVKGEGAKAMHSSREENEGCVAVEERPEKRVRSDLGMFQKFFIRKDERADLSDGSSDARESSPGTTGHLGCPLTSGGDVNGRDRKEQSLDSEGLAHAATNEVEDHRSVTNDSPQIRQQPITAFTCSRCSKTFPVAKREEHGDWHFAKDLQAKDKPPPTEKVLQHPPTRPRGTGDTGRNKAEKGQSRLAFKR
ncbi:hypothetical protein FGG08_001291 [Glutinoglossum americanum]|uniref:DNA polymerase eta n=1 Tax=Glutinoglossum americanum TaxID=1670608 RepID=A0A9P8IDW5_9PEZI|nr:hypothetical protein FGG08_001291 [Glutinoglossum americanum]